MFSPAISSVLMQVSYSSSSTSTSSSGANIAGLLIFVVVAFVIGIAIGALCFWKVLEKGGRPGWASLIPVYNAWLLFEMSGKSGALALLYLGGMIPIIGFIFSLTASIMLAMAVGKAFGKEGGFIVGLVLLPFIFYPILGFGSAQYRGGVTPQGFPVGPPGLSHVAL